MGRLPKLGSLTYVVIPFEGPTRTTDWRNTSSEDSHQEESLAQGWFKYPSGHWGRKFSYGRSNHKPPKADISLV
ncbi:hypothetical protein DSO57_1001703 [Entomophthora muscae]|uniref:Uncharacterized protein n=1 Tax=Entomophthora muscae TaxID=34485 RepID=A0ACC2SLN9_9FUNG|nr:hypothetical protein DSO57_1001703 [Entomophthora muscae]